MKKASFKMRFLVWCAIGEKMPDEKHSTIYHPAALKAFRLIFKPDANERK
jgi:hypothetical protein